VPDEFMNPDAPPAPVPQDATGAVNPKANRKGLFIALAAVGVLAVIAGIVAAVVVFVLNGAEGDLGQVVTPTTPSGTGSTATTDAPVAASPADPVANDEVFTFRDIFTPLVGATSSGGTTDTADGTETVDTTEFAADTLYLLAIQTDGDSPQAQMVWDQKEYLLSEGDVIPNTPWKVLDIRTDDVVMLFGDQQVVLSVGQGISK